MQSKNKCPHCGNRAVPLIQKLMDCGITSRPCQSCGELVKLNISTTHFFLGFFWLIPALALPRPWQKFTVALCVLIGLGIYRVLRYSYEKALHPIRYDA